MNTSNLLKRIDYLISKGKTALSTSYESSGFGGVYVEHGHYVGFRTACLSFISNLYGFEHTYYKEFENKIKNNNDYIIESGIAIMESIREEVEQGWLISFKQLVTVEVFSDFLEMSKYFLNEGYKDPAAVMIGSVLEEHLRQLCTNHLVEVTVTKGNDIVPKKADLLNSDLAKAKVYGVLEQKNVTAWLDLRNRAAHGKYNEYSSEQVNIMYLGVLDFVSRIN